MSRRRSTVYDVAALRLHPSGVRVPLSVESAPPRKRTHAKQGSRGNWFATDAAGDERVAKRRKIVKATSSNGEHLETQNSEQVIEDAPARFYKDNRSNRRLAFQNDLSFLGVSQSESEHNNERLHLQPSSDFLKCLHHFASHYYGARDELFDSAKQYRKEKAEKRRLRKMRRREDNSEREGENANEQLSVSNDSESPDSNSKGKEPKATKSRKPRIKDDKKDMYKAFDGSALLCIGMLLQAHINSFLIENVPLKWEEELRNYKGPFSEPTDFVTLNAPRKRIKNY